MSLILEALKKLEREREVPGRGFLVVAPSAWPAGGRARAVRVGAVVLTAGLAAAAGAWMARRAPLAEPARQAAPAPDRAAAASLAAPPVAVEGRRAGAALPPPIWEAAPRRAAAAPGPPAGAGAGAVLPAAAPADTPAAPPDELRLEAISTRDGEPVAVINGRLLRAGERLGDVEVVSIGADSVELSVAGRRRVLSF